MMVRLGNIFLQSLQVAWRRARAINTTRHASFGKRDLEQIALVAIIISPCV
jgi:hypothetical protein